MNTKTRQTSREESYASERDLTEVLKKIRRIEIFTRRLVNDVFSGEYHSVFKGQGMEFDEVREYQPGDDVRSIDWNVTARMGTPYVKRFIEERELVVIFLLDVSASGRFGSGEKTKLDTAAEICAVLAFSAIQNNDKVGAVIFSDDVEEYIPPDKGRRHALHVIRKILFYQPKGRGTDIATSLSYLLRVMKRRAVVFLLSDFLSPDFSQELALAAKKFDLVALKIRDPREEIFSSARMVRLWDQERGVEHVIDLTGRNAVNRFRNKIRERDTALTNLFNRCGVDVIDIDTHSDYIQPLELFFRARAKRR
ncbi:MAG: DUF58 domain-containing protein [Candidatus Latescibacteria bacterium]|nr:DUF58 domain-containing protein [Candidatus Latescibacterota bacterium]NIM22529.1 DUF58 domain-containing protein [Candidatus Latescibacterota bacterium]NIM64843.1 DUF58 domain-containing protein [Candidatus Latescibacterota bacterium]NIO01351.1 DUF58 domain-containing protein [Candidatus Latescibacterota bacterium]NIO27840.1 DUF58 domain-containing protein [Candidatus Latescibacterota bacterium]